MEKIRLIYLTLILFCCCQLSAQNKTVTGQVTAAGSEEPIIGASVVVRGTSNGTITDVDGNFSLSVPVGKELQISYIGYITQYVRVPKNNKVAVVLEEDSKALDEVVVVAFGTQKKESMINCSSIFSSPLFFVFLSRSCIIFIINSGSFYNPFYFRTFFFFTLSECHFFSSLR